MKGGGLAKLLYPAHVVGLILCDVPGEHYDIVASGPTYYDATTAEDAKKLLETYGITEAFTFIETPKDETLFASVTNVPVVSNRVALDAMTTLASSWGYNVISLGDERYDDPASIIDGFLKVATPKSVVVGGGEPRMIVTSGGGIGGRNEYLSAKMIESIPPGAVFVSFASDGIDNCSEAAGGIIDSSLREKVATLPESVTMYLDTYKHDELLATLGARILVGPTEANVSDLFFLITP
jgi:glycerate-2-kinase